MKLDLKKSSKARKNNTNDKMQVELWKGYINTCRTLTRNSSEMIGLSGAETASYKFSLTKKLAHSFVNLII